MVFFVELLFIFKIAISKSHHYNKMNIPFEERAATKRKIIKCNWGDKNCLKKKKVAESFSI